MVNESRPIRILLVEDNELNRDMLSRRLQRRGFEVLTALDGENAVQITADIKPDIVLMDMRLPGMNGWDAARILKSDEKTRNVPVIALTAHAMSADREQAFAAGCDAF
jgi:two-component system cell cycle response regulator DivK